MSIYSEYKLGYMDRDEFEQAVRDEAWLDKVRSCDSDPDEEEEED